MKNTFILLFMLAGTNIQAQDSLNSFSYSRNHIITTGMKVLVSWGIANVGVGIAGWASSKNSSGKYFYQMNTFWGATNIGLSLLGYNAAKRKLNKQLSATENLKAQQNIERTFLTNAILDVGYTGAGIFLNTRGSNRNNAQLKGYGSSVIMQGIFLFLFDGAMYKIQRKNGNRLRQFIKRRR